jgi:hypothetical protein
MQAMPIYGCVICIHLYECVYVDEYICMHVCVHVYLWMYLYVNVCMVGEIFHLFTLKQFKFII